MRILCKSGEGVRVERRGGEHEQVLLKIFTVRVYYEQSMDMSVITHLRRTIICFPLLSLASDQIKSNIYPS